MYSKTESEKSLIAYSKFIIDKYPSHSIAMDLSLKIIYNLIENNPTLPFPDMAPCGISAVLIAFDENNQYLEFETFNNGNIEVFYRDRNSNELLSWDFSSYEELINNYCLFQNQLNLFLKGEN